MGFSKCLWDWTLDLSIVRQLRRPVSRHLFEKVNALSLSLLIFPAGFSKVSSYTENTFLIIEQVSFWTISLKAAAAECRRQRRRWRKRRRRRRIDNFRRSFLFLSQVKMFCSSSIGRDGQAASRTSGSGWSAGIRKQLGPFLLRGSWRHGRFGVRQGRHRLAHQVTSELFLLRKPYST